MSAPLAVVKLSDCKRYVRMSWFWNICNREYGTIITVIYIGNPLHVALLFVDVGAVLCSSLPKVCFPKPYIFLRKKLWIQFSLKRCKTMMKFPRISVRGSLSHSHKKGFSQLLWKLNPTLLLAISLLLTIVFVLVNIATMPTPKHDRNYF